MTTALKALTLKVPGLKKSVGAGDVVSAVTKKLGIKECGGCAKRKAALNEKFKFSGSKTK